MATWRIIDDGEGAGGLLCPPGHPNLRYTLESGHPNNPNFWGSIEYAVDPENADEVSRPVFEQALRIMAEATLVRSEAWEANVYGYFKNSWSPDGVERNVSRLDMAKGWHEGEDGEPVFDRDPAHHAAYLCVRSYFPDAEPRLDLIVSGGDYGQKKCSTCGNYTQYEARTDDYRIHGNLDQPSAGLCADGKPHTI